MPASTQDLFHSKTYLISLQLMIYAPVSIIAVYIAIHILLPHFIYPGKYLALFGCNDGPDCALFYNGLADYLSGRGADPALSYAALPVSVRWFRPVRYGIGFPLTSTILVIIFKLFKNYHLKQKEHALLLRQKINTELQLLKTRFRPQFLHSALQHISSLISNKSVESRSILIKLSDLLSYVLYENEKEMVPLENELEILKTFLILKNTFHPGTFIIQYDQQVESDHLFISPLLLLSIVENCLENLYQSEKNRNYTST